MELEQVYQAIKGRAVLFYISFKHYRTYTYAVDIWNPELFIKELNLNLKLLVSLDHNDCEYLISTAVAKYLNTGKPLLGITLPYKYMN